MISKVMILFALVKSKENKSDETLINKIINRWMDEEIEKNESISYYPITKAEMSVVFKYV